MATTITQPVLVYDRIAQNRRKTVFLVAIAILSIIPFVAGASYLGAQWALAQLGHRPIGPEVEAQLRAEMAESRVPGEIRTEYDSAVERQIEASLTKLHKKQAENERLQWQVTLVFALGVTSILGLLFWSLASSPTSQILAMCGARPAGAAEAEAKRLLENLSIGAGLPVPKLYVIDSPVPNAFAAGMDPSRSVVAVTHGLLALLDHRELEGVLAHELSHVGNRDTRLNTVVTAITLFLRLPYLLRQRQLKARRQAGYQWSPMGRSRYRLVYTAAALPIYIYVFFIAPLLALVIRAAISRSREFQADADAALLTRYPEGLLRALAKVRGAGSAVSGQNTLIAHLYFSDPSKSEGLMSFFRGHALATHPPIEVRINRLMEFNGGVPISVLEAAARVGVEFAKNHPAIPTPSASDTMAQDELSVLTTGTPMGRVYRVLSEATLYDQPSTSRPLVRIKAGALVVVFDNPGKFRQILTHDETFGYMPSSVKLQKVDMLPAEIHDPVAREAAIRALESAASEATATAAAAQNGSNTGLTGTQIAITAALGVAVFAGIFLAMMKFGGN